MSKEIDDKDSAATSLFYTGEFVGGPYDGMVLQVYGVSPPCSVSVDQGVKFLNAATMKLTPANYANSRYDLVLAAVDINGELCELEEFMQDQHEWAQMLSEAKKTPDGHVAVACKYEWDGSI